jgi:hypothetical protein
VRDPTLRPTKPLDEALGLAERERWVAMQKKKPIVLQRINHNEHLSISKGGFSGAIYKRMLEAKEREIAQLRRKLYDTIKMHGSELTNVNKLRVALSRSVHYYTFAVNTF